MSDRKLIYCDDAMAAVDKRIADLSQHEAFQRKSALSAVIDVAGVKKHIIDIPPVKVDRGKLMSILSHYFSIGDSYTFELTRVKDAFEVGTMTFDDFQEWDENNIADLCDYIIEQYANDKNCGAREDDTNGRYVG